MVYVLMTNAATLSYYVQCFYCSIFTSQFKSISNTVYDEFCHVLFAIKCEDKGKIIQMVILAVLHVNDLFTIHT